MLDEPLEFLERRLARLDDQGAGLPLHVPDLALDLLGLAEFLEPFLELRPRDASRLHAVVIREREDPHVHEVRFNRRDVLDRCHLDLRRDLAHLLEVAVTALHVQLHDRGGGDTPSIDDLDEPRQAEGDVHLRDARVVKRPHRVVRDDAVRRSERLEAGDGQVVHEIAGWRNLFNFKDLVPEDVLVQQCAKSLHIRLDVHSKLTGARLKSRNVARQGRPADPLTAGEVVHVPGRDPKPLRHGPEGIPVSGNHVQGIVRVPAAGIGT